MSREVAISINSVSKQYRLGEIRAKTLQGDLQSWWAKVRGKEDPNSIVGMDYSRKGEQFLALNDVSLTVYKGETLGIIGGNGAGKSTLLKILSRVTAPTAGEVDIYGRVSSMLEVGTGFNAQMTGRENIYMNGSILGMTKAEIDAKMDDIIEFSEIGEFIDTPVKRYSSGMFVKLAFAVAAHLNSEIMIMDEVLAVGDVAFQKKCLRKMRENAMVEGKTVLYVSHNMATIRELCQRCIVVEKGKIVFDGDVDEAIHTYLTMSTESGEVDMDLTQKPHADRVAHQGLTMTHLNLLDKLQPVYDNTDLLKMRFTLRVTKPAENVRLRVTLRSDTDIPVGTAWSKPRSFTTVGEVQEDFEMPLKLLSQGTYYASIGFYTMDDAGIMRSYDHITRAFKVEVNPSVKIRAWHSGVYGNINFPSF